MCSPWASLARSLRSTRCAGAKIFRSHTTCSRNSSNTRYPGTISSFRHPATRARNTQDAVRIRTALPRRIGSSQRTTASLSAIASRLATISPDFARTLTSSEQRKFAGHDRTLLNGGPPVPLSALEMFSIAPNALKIVKPPSPAPAPPVNRRVPPIAQVQPEEFVPHIRRALVPPLR